MNYAHTKSQVLITGVSGSGKTTFLLDLLHRYRSADGRKARWLFGFDPEGELSHKLHRPGAATLAEIAALTESGVCLFDPSRMYPGRYSKAFGFWCDYCFTFSAEPRHRGVKLFVCDELQKWVGTSKGELPIELTTIIETGRRYEVDCVWISQQPNLIHNRIRNQATRVVSFQQQDGNAIRYMEELGFDVAELRSLPRGHFVSKDCARHEFTRGKVCWAR